MNDLLQKKRRLRWWHALAFFALAIGLLFTIMFVFQALAMSGILGSTSEEIMASLSTPGMMGFQILLTSGIVAVVGIVGGKRGGDVKESLRLGGGSRWMVVLGVLGVIPLGFLVDQVTAWLHMLMPEAFDPTALIQMAKAFSTAGPLGFILVTVAVAAFPAVGEELLFRGLVLRALQNDVGKALSVTISAAAFGLMHMDVLQGTGAFIIGLYLGFLAVRSGSILPAVFAHGANNLLCALYARIDPEGMGLAFTQGHGMPVILGSCVSLAVVLWVLFKTSSSRNSNIAKVANS